jgi:hypothetical protein
MIGLKFEKAQKEIEIGIFPEFVKETPFSENGQWNNIPSNYININYNF